MESKNVNYLFNREYTEALLKGRKAENLNTELITAINDSISNNIKKGLPEAILDEVDVHKAYFAVRYPGVLVGLGYPHELSEGPEQSELKGQISGGFMFDYVTGLPYIPGSSIKGIVRHIFDNACDNDEYLQYLNSICENKFTEEQLKEYIHEHFGMTDGGGTDVFYDAYVSGPDNIKDYIGLENITPHSNALKNPIPITMLKIMPGVLIKVAIKTDDKSFCVYKRILQDMGVGAKTNVGFGIIEEVKNKNNTHPDEKGKKSQEKTEKQKIEIDSSSPWAKLQNLKFD